MLHEIKKLYSAIFDKNKTDWNRALCTWMSQTHDRNLGYHTHICLPRGLFGDLKNVENTLLVMINWSAG